MSAHSPGPWFVHPLFQTSVMNKEGDVAEASPANPRRFYDARLIAAAPDLLAALREQMAKCWCLPPASRCSMCERHAALISQIEST